MSQLNLSSRLQALWNSVEDSYKASKRPQAHWMWAKHVPVVAENALRLAGENNADVERAVAGALLHDIADTELERDKVEFEHRNEEIIETKLTEAGFTEEEKKFIKNEVVAPHSCYPENMPTTLEGKILATADSMAHLATDFYREVYSVFFTNRKTDAEFKEWGQKKLVRDFNDKLFFENVREEMKPFYERLTVEFK